MRAADEIANATGDRVAWAVTIVPGMEGRDYGVIYTNDPTTFPTDAP